jgi:hypothetical protein
VILSGVHVGESLLGSLSTDAHNGDYHLYRGVGLSLQTVGGLNLHQHSPENKTRFNRGRNLDSSTASAATDEIPNQTLAIFLAMCQ